MNKAGGTGEGEYQGCAFFTPSNLKPLICCIVPSSSLRIWENGLEWENTPPCYWVTDWASNHLHNKAFD